MNGRILICGWCLLGIVVSPAIAQQGQAGKAPQLRAEAVSQNVDALVRQLSVARRRLSGLGRQHPLYEASRRRVAELEAELRSLSSDGEGGSSPLPTKQQPSLVAQQSGPVTSAVRSQESIKPLISEKSFELVGGWLLPSAGAGGKGLGFSRAGLYLEHGAGKERQLYTFGHGGSKDTHVLKVSLDHYGSDPRKRFSWPVAEPIKLLANTHTIKSNDAYTLCRPNPGGALLTTGRVFYATDPANWGGPWMNWYTSPGRPTPTMAVEKHVDRRQVYGGGFCTIPKWFADQYLDGRDFGVGFGGYQSGQTSSPGPTLFVCDRPADHARQLTNCIELLAYRWGGGKGEREERPADYGTPLWGPMVENGTGWWQADMVIAGPVWVDTPRLTGLCYWSVQGLGDLDYNLQDVAFSNNRRIRLYVYDPTDFAQVIAGALRPYQVRGRFYEWDLPFDKDAGARRWPIGAHWDPEDQLLYMSYQNSGAGQYDIPPAVVIYRLP